MKMNLNNILKNISYSVLANAFSLIVSVVMLTFVPKIIGVKDYGIWQLYIFYSTYLGVFHFGWLDGIYLRYGNYDFIELDKKKFSGQFYSIFIFEFFVSIFIYLLIKLCVEDVIKQVTGQYVCLLILPVILYTFCSFILQITNRIKDYAKVIFFERVLFLVLLVIYLFFGNITYLGLFYIDILCKILLFFFSFYLIKDLIILKIDNFANIIIEIYKNITVGIKLLVANLASLCIVGIIRFGIAEHWNVEVFGKVSFSLGITNFLMVFINAIGVVIFPLLARSNLNEKKEVFLLGRCGLNILFFSLLILYYPLINILDYWLPQYEDSFKYMAILFPICFFESKVGLLISALLKSLRQEALMLKINFIVLLLSMLLSFISIICMDNLLFTVIVILLVLGLRCIISEIKLGKLLDFSIDYNLIIELFIISLFILCAYNKYSLLISLISYTALYVFYIYINFTNIKALIKKLRKGDAL